MSSTGRLLLANAMGFNCEPTNSVSVYQPSIPQGEDCWKPLLGMPRPGSTGQGNDTPPTLSSCQTILASGSPRSLTELPGGTRITTRPGAFPGRLVSTTAPSDFVAGSKTTTRESSELAIT